MEQRNEKNSGTTWKALFSTLGKLRLPWLWVLAALVMNTVLNTLLLEIPDMTAKLLGGDLSAKAVTEAVIYYIAYGILSFVGVAVQVQAQSFGVRRSRESIWRKMLGMKMEHYDRNDASDLMSTIINDAGNAANDIVNVIVYIIPDVYYVVAALLKINRYHSVLALSCFAMLPLKYIYVLIMGKKVQTATTRSYDRIGELTSFLADRISHLPLIKTYTNEQSESEKGRQAANGLLKANMRLVRLDNISAGIAAFLDILQKFIVVVVAVILLQRKEIDIAMWLAFFLFAQNLFPTMDAVFEYWVRIKAIKGSFERASGIMNGEDEPSGTAASPENGEVRFENVTFTYPGADAPALKNVCWMRFSSCSFRQISLRMGRVRSGMIKHSFHFTTDRFSANGGGNAKNFFLLFNGLFSQKLDTLLKNMRPCFCESGSALYLRI